MENETIPTERDLGNGGVYFRNRAPFPHSPRVMLAGAAKKTKTSSVTWADDLSETNPEIIRENGSITVHQNGRARNENAAANGGLGILKSQHLEENSACVVEIRKNSIQQSNKQTFTSSSTQNGDAKHCHTRTGGNHFADLMKSRRLESLRKNADEKNRSENNQALLGTVVERDEPYRNKVEFFSIVLTFMLGLGNVVRFSFLCHRNGGGAFFIPYFIMLFFEGIPLICLEMAVGQRYGKFSLYHAWIDLGPSLAGLGLAAIVENLIVVFYYNVMVSWCLYFCIQSLRDSLLWKPCPTVTTTTGNQSYQTVESECLKSGPQKYFWYRKSLHISDDMNTFSGSNMIMYIFIVACWVCTFLLSMKALKHSSKGLSVVLLLIVINLVIFFFFAVNLEGWAEGLAFLFTFDNLDRINDIQVWMAAAGQIFFSMAIGYGSTILFASGNKRNNSFCVDALLVSLANSGTSLWASIIMFSFFGYRTRFMVKKCRIAMTSNSSQEIMSFMMSSNIQGNSTASVLGHGTRNCSRDFFFEQIPEGMSLAFVGMTQAFVEMNKSSAFPALFFFFLFLLGISSVPGMIHILVNSCIEFGITPKSWRREIVAGVICFVVCLGNLIFVQSPGLYILELIDNACSFPLLVIGFCECIGISYVYGIDKFSEDILTLTGSELSWKWKFCWKFVSPLIILGLIIGSIINFIKGGKLYYNAWDSNKGQLTSLPYPTWAYVLYAFLIIVPLVCLVYPFLKSCFKTLRNSDILRDKLMGCAVCKDIFETCQDSLGQRSGTYDLTSPVNFVDYDNEMLEMNRVQATELRTSDDNRAGSRSANTNIAHSPTVSVSNSGSDGNSDKRSHDDSINSHDNNGLVRTSRDNLHNRDSGTNNIKSGQSSPVARASTSEYCNEALESELSDKTDQTLN